jgi:hypothetical protein
MSNNEYSVPGGRAGGQPHGWPANRPVRGWS